MSKKSAKTRIAFFSGLALLQLILLPANQLLHVGCDHSHAGGAADSGTHASCPPASAVSATTSLCHCKCHHSHAPANSSRSGDSSEGDRETPHDSGNCPLCQVVLAARIATLHVVQVPVSARQVPCSAPVAPLPVEEPIYRCLSRGPPIGTFAV